MIARQIYALFVRDYKTNASYRFAVVLRVVSIIFYLAIFYYISQLLNQPKAEPLRPFNSDYFAFVLIGLAINSFMTIGFSIYAEAIRTEQLVGTFEAIFSSQVKLTAYLIGSVAWPFLHSLAIALIYLAAGQFLFQAGLNFSQFGLIALIFLLTFICFSAIGIILAAVIVVVKQGEPLIALFAMLNTILGGVYFPVSFMPELWQKIAWVLPMTHSLRALRSIMIGGANFSSVWTDLRILLAIALALMPLAYYIFLAALNHARKSGSLGHY